MINSKIRVISSNIGRFLSRGGSIEYFDFALADTTFTAGMAKRAAPGPFAAAPVIQGELNSATSTLDKISYSRGSQIKNNFYSVIDTNQGSLVLWYTPEYDSSDFSVESYIFVWYINGGDLGFTSNHSLRFRVNGNTCIGPADFVAGTTYCIVARWDTDNTLDGTNHVCLSVNDVAVFNGTLLRSTNTPIANNVIGYYSNLDRFSAHAIIEGFTIYRRPLFDGTYGIDVGNGDELALIYAAGSGKDPTEITGSWDVCFCLPTNSQVGPLVTG